MAMPHSSAQTSNSPPSFETLDSNTTARDTNAPLPGLPATIIDTTDALSDMLDALAKPAALDQDPSHELQFTTWPYQLPHQLYICEVITTTNTFLRIHDHDGDRTYLVHLNALEQAAWTERGKLNEMTLKDILEDLRIQKVLFDCRTTSNFLFRNFGVVLRSVLDLQVMDIVFRPSITFLTAKRGHRLPSLSKCISLLPLNKADLLIFEAYMQYNQDLKDQPLTEDAPLLLDHRIIHAQSAQYQVQLMQFLWVRLGKPEAPQLKWVAQVSCDRLSFSMSYEFRELSFTPGFMNKLDFLSPRRSKFGAYGTSALGTKPIQRAVWRSSDTENTPINFRKTVASSHPTSDR
jgi:hypothetical protein